MGISIVRIILTLREVVRDIDNVGEGGLGDDEEDEGEDDDDDEGEDEDGRVDV